VAPAAGKRAPRGLTDRSVKLSITQRLTMLWSVLFILTLVIFAGLAETFGARSAQVAVDQRLLAQTAVAAAGIDQSAQRLALDMPREPLVESALVLYRGRSVIQVIGEAPPRDVVRRAALLLPDRPTTLTLDESYRVVLHTVGDGSNLRIAAFASELPVREETDRLHRILIGVALPVTALSVGAGWLLARRSLAPIDRLTRTAADVANTGRFSTRFPVETRDELGRLGSTFNAMLERLETTYERERSFIGDISHELRQPLTTITGEVELTLEDELAPSARTALQRIAERAATLRSLVDDLLLLARADAHALEAGSADVSESVVEAANAVRLLYPHVALNVRVLEHVMNVRISSGLLERLFVNVIRNAVQAARSQVNVTVSREANDAVIVIDDDGPGIPEAARNDVFRRFFRLPQPDRAPGTGLGLTIAAAIANVANGSMTIGDAPERGARFSVRLPIAV